MTEQRRLAAIMFSDICGYSRIMGENESRALELVGMSSSCIEEATGIYGGRVIKKMGDGVLVEFPSAVNAVQCALDVQKAVAKHNASASPDERFLLRIGIHVGDVVVSDGDILGDGVNVASRIEPLAEPGGICISRDVFDLVHSKISIETVNLGPKDLKNISRRIDIYQVLIDAVGKKKRCAGFPSRIKPKTSLLIVGALVIVLLAVIFFPIIKKRHFHKSARRAFEFVTKRSFGAAESGNLDKARDILEAYPARFSDTEWQSRIEQGIEKLSHRIAVKQIGERQKDLLRAIQDNDRDGAMVLVDPALLRKADAEVFWLKLRALTGIFRATRIGADSFKIEKINLSEDGNTAEVCLKVLRTTPDDPGGKWENVAPLKWRLVEDTWFFHPEPTKRPSDVRDDVQRVRPQSREKWRMKQ